MITCSATALEQHREEDDDGEAVEVRVLLEESEGMQQEQQSAPLPL